MGRDPSVLPSHFLELGLQKHGNVPRIFCGSWGWRLGSSAHEAEFIPCILAPHLLCVFLCLFVFSEDLRLWTLWLAIQGVNSIFLLFIHNGSDHWRPVLSLLNSTMDHHVTVLTFESNTFRDYTITAILCCCCCYFFLKRFKIWISFFIYSTY